MNCSKKKHLFDYKRLARSDEPLVYEFVAADMVNTQDMLDEATPIHVEVRSRYEFDEYFLNIRVSAKLNLVCQRCLGHYQSDLQAENDFIVVRDEFDAKIEQFSDFEPVLKADMSRINLGDLVAEEILLNIPAIPKHQEDSLCKQDVAELAI